ncbi:unnamed protein product [Closterium sp. NIES-65]|nr:unnamed protein product [Closterium sp. NIES-65]
MAAGAYLAKASIASTARLHTLIAPSSVKVLTPFATLSHRPSFAQAKPLLTSSFRPLSQQLRPRPLTRLAKFPLVSRVTMSTAAGEAADRPVPVEDGDYEWDLVTIGVGSGGTRASRIAASFGAKVAAIELPFNPISSETQGGVGGTCVLRGCVPKKILVYGSAFSSEFEVTPFFRSDVAVPLVAVRVQCCLSDRCDAAGFGWSIPGTPTFDWKHLIANKTREIERLNGVYKRILSNAGVTLVEGRGKLLGPHEVEVTDPSSGIVTRMTAKHILIAVGGRPHLIDIPGKSLPLSTRTLQADSWLMSLSPFTKFAYSCFLHPSNSSPQLLPLHPRPSSPLFPPFPLSPSPLPPSTSPPPPPISPMTLQGVFENSQKHPTTTNLSHGKARYHIRQRLSAWQSYCCFEFTLFSSPSLSFSPSPLSLPLLPFLFPFSPFSSPSPFLFPFSPFSSPSPLSPSPSPSSRPLPPLPFSLPPLPVPFRLSPPLPPPPSPSLPPTPSPHGRGVRHYIRRGAQPGGVSQARAAQPKPICVCPLLSPNPSHFSFSRLPFLAPISPLASSPFPRFPPPRPSLPPDPLPPPLVTPSPFFLCSYIAVEFAGIFHGMSPPLRFWSPLPLTLHLPAPTPPSFSPRSNIAVEFAGISHGMGASLLLNPVFSPPPHPPTSCTPPRSYIAVEFAGIFHGMGADVHLVYRQPTPLRYVCCVLPRPCGMCVVCCHAPALYVPHHAPEIEKTASGTYVLHTDKGEALEADVVMFATGRAPSTHNLGLENAGVETDSIGAIKVSAWSQTNVPSVWAVGDVTNRINLTPVALMEGHCFARTVFGNDPDTPDFENVASAVFCPLPFPVLPSSHPRLAVVDMRGKQAVEREGGSISPHLVGLTEKQAVESSSSDVLVFTSSFNPMKNTISGRVEKTYMKLLVDSETDRVLGASMCGPDAAEIMQVSAMLVRGMQVRGIQGLGVAMKCNVTKKQVDSTVGIHPTAAEEFVTMRTPTRRLPGMKKKE